MATPARPGIARPGLTIPGLDVIPATGPSGIKAFSTATVLQGAGGGTIRPLFMTSARPGIARPGLTVPGLLVQPPSQAGSGAASVAGVSDPRDGTAGVT